MFGIPEDAIDAQRWIRIEQLYLSAAELEGDRRNESLAVACQGDEELPREVESMLAQGGPTGALI